MALRVELAEGSGRLTLLQPVTTNTPSESQARANLDSLQRTFAAHLFCPLGLDKQGPVVLSKLLFLLPGFVPSALQIMPLSSFSDCSAWMNIG